MKKNYKSVLLLLMVFFCVLGLTCVSEAMGRKTETAPKEETLAVSQAKETPKEAVEKKSPEESSSPAQKTPAAEGSSFPAQKTPAAEGSSSPAQKTPAVEESKSAIGESLQGIIASDGSLQSLNTLQGITGSFGDKLASVFAESSGSTLPSSNLSGMMPIPGVGMPPLSIGGMEEALLPIGGMATSPSMDAFPPFFGDSVPQAPSGQPGMPTPASALVGTWTAQHGQQLVSMVFQADGSYTLKDKGQQVNGRYEVQGDRLILRFPDGRSFTLQFSIQGEYLVFSDGSYLLRQKNGEINNTPATPQQAPQPEAQPVPSNGLEGTWAASDGSRTLIMMFMNGVCGLNVNGRQFYGPYTVQGNQLYVQFMNAKPLRVSFSVEGNVLRFSDGTVLMRQQMPNTAGTQPIPSTEPQQPGVWGQPQEAQQPVPQQSQSVSPLEGAWGTQLPNGVTIVFVFKGNQYSVLTNGQQTEAGIFTLNGNLLEYTTTSGQAAGNKGVNTWQINGNVLLLTMQNGSSVQLTRRAQ